MLDCPGRAVHVYGAAHAVTMRCIWRDEVGKSIVNQSPYLFSTFFLSHNRLNNRDGV